MADELVSVIIPTFNRAKYIVDAVSSILHQSYRNINCIVVDDGSEDNTFDLLRPFMDQIDYVRTKNRGVSSARNEGIRRATGAYITFLDSDDLLLSHAIERLLSQPLGDREIRFSRQRFLHIGEFDDIEGPARKPVWPKTDENGLVIRPLEELCSGAYFQINGMIAQSDVVRMVGPFRENLVAAEDYEWFFRGALKFDLHFTKEILVERRFHDKQTGLHKKENIESMINAAKIMRNSAIKAGSLRIACIANIAIANHYSRLANANWLNGDSKLAGSASLLAFFNDPRKPQRLVKALLQFLGSYPPR